MADIHNPDLTRMGICTQAEEDKLFNEIDLCWVVFYFFKVYPILKRKVTTKQLDIDYTNLQYRWREETAAKYWPPNCPGPTVHTQLNSNHCCWSLHLYFPPSQSIICQHWTQYLTQVFEFYIWVYLNEYKEKVSLLFCWNNS